MVKQVERMKTKREFNGQEYVLTKIDYAEEAAKEDQAWHKERGVKTKIVQEGIFWLVYTKVGV